MKTISPTSVAAWVLRRDGDRLRGYVLVVLGQPGWHHANVVSIGGGATDATGIPGWEWGPRTVAVDYDTLRNTAVVFGTRIALDSAPVVLVDRVDSVGGLPLVRRAVCPTSLSPDEPAALYRDDPTVREFVDGARARDGRRGPRT